MNARVQIKIEQIARYRVMGVHDGVIAAKLGMTQSGLSRILALPEYKELEAAVLAGQVTKMDQALAGKIEPLKEYARQGVPLALRALVEAATQQRDLRARISAASELLDRDPDKTFVKGHVKLSEEAAVGMSEGTLDHLTAHADKIATEKEKQVIQ